LQSWLVTFFLKEDRFEPSVQSHNKSKTQQSKKLVLIEGEGENSCTKWVDYSIQSLHVQYVKGYKIYVRFEFL
jgi:hypothetical protein